MVSANHGTAAAVLAVLAALLPFEPRAPLLVAGPVRVTALEAAAALATVAILPHAWGGLAALVRRPPAPLALLALYAAAHLASAAAAPAERGAAFKFALRMVAMAGFALVVAALPAAAHRRALGGLVVGGTVAAALAVLEGVGVRALDPLLNLFREAPFNVGGVRRASAGSEYPNLAAGMMVAALVAWPGRSASARLIATLPVSALLVAGLLFTYSRGALAAAAVGLAVLVLALRAGRRLTAPALAGLGVLVVGSALFAGAGEVVRLRLGGEGTREWYGVLYEPAERSFRLAPGEVRVTRVRLTNSGRLTWGADRDFHLSYHWYDRDRRDLADGGRTRLPRDVAPGESVEVDAEVHAPERDGRYLLVWDMVQEETTWFSGQGVRPAVVPVQVGSAAAPSEAGGRVPEPEAVAWTPTRRELWGIALGMWRERPLLGFGPDSFRRLHGARAGQAHWDTRVYANNLLLEAAATTGAAGLLTLAGALVAAGLRAFRRAAAGGDDAGLAATLLALVAAVAAHGVFDYLLAFTGHYLLLGLIVGAISASSADHPAAGR